MLWVDSELVVNNEHTSGQKKKCETKFMTDGYHNVTVEYWWMYNNKDLAAYYNGPDTNNEESLLAGDKVWAPPKPAESNWIVKVYDIENSQRWVPEDYGSLHYVDKVFLPFLDVQYRELQQVGNAFGTRNVALAKSHR